MQNLPLRYHESSASNSLARVDDFINEAEFCQNLEQMCQILREYTADLGFEKFSYLLLMPSNGKLKPFYISSYPREWTQRYVENKYISQDMVARHAARVMLPFSWTEIGLLKEFTPEQQLPFNEAREFGIKAGASIPIHGPGRTRSLFTVANGMSSDDFNKLFLRYRHELHLISAYAYDRFVKMGLYDIADLPAKLSPREIEILTWYARGKARQDIAAILCISETTVITHLRKIREKLDVNNTTQAVAAALQFDLIIP